MPDRHSALAPHGDGLHGSITAASVAKFGNNKNEKHI